MKPATAPARVDPISMPLSNFWSTLGSGRMIPHWETATELNHLGFHIERADSPTGPRTHINLDLFLSRSPGCTAMGACSVYPSSVDR